MVKHIVATILCVCLVVSLPQTAAAIGESGRLSSSGSGTTYKMRWTHHESIALAMRRTGNEVGWSGYIVGQPGTTKITATFYLYKDAGVGWMYVGSWPALTTNSSILISSGSAVGTAGRYKLIVYSSATRNGTTENVNVSHEQNL
jgi:hypothetical protein